MSNAYLPDELLDSLDKKHDRPDEVERARNLIRAAGRLHDVAGRHAHWAPNDVAYNSRARIVRLAFAEAALGVMAALGGTLVTTHPDGPLGAVGFALIGTSLGVGYTYNTTVVPRLLNEVEASQPTNTLVQAKCDLSEAFEAWRSNDCPQANEIMTLGRICVAVAEARDRSTPDRVGQRDTSSDNTMGIAIA